MTNPIEVAERLEAARRAKNQPVTVFAETAGMAEKTYRRRIAAPAQFTLDELCRAASAADTTLESLLGAPGDTAAERHSKPEAA